MRLLDTRTGEFRWVDNPEEVRYAILSHTWSPEGEQTYADLLTLQAEVCAAREHLSDSNTPLPENEVLLRASPKIRCVCERALAEGYDLIWIDSGCIDKTNSVELSEAINSMFQWYRNAAVCYAFLADVGSDEDPDALDSQFRHSRWFTRGWTLQELIAPRAVFFYSKEWEMLGGKDSLARVIQEITGIDAAILVHVQQLSSVSVARRMSWAAKRTTTRKEDEAYALMGIFAINMPTIYGEGRLAFVRLQEEILKVIPDQSIFAWENGGGAWVTDFNHKKDEYPRTLLAASPADFIHSGCIRSVDAAYMISQHIAPIPSMLPTYEITAYGLYTTLPIVALHDNYELALLACTNDADEAVALVLERHKISRTVGAPFAKREVTDPDRLYQHQSWEELAWRPFLHPNDRKIRETTSLGYVRMVYLSGHSRWLHRNNGMGWFYYDMTMQRVCIVHRPQRETLSYRRGDGRFGPQGAPQLQVRVPARCRSRLATMGYAVSVYTPRATSTSANSDLRTTHSVSPLQVPAQPVIIAVFRCVSAVDDSTIPVAIIRIAPSFCDCHRHSEEGLEDSWYIRAYVTSPTGHALEVADRSHGNGRRRTRLCRRCRHDRYADVELWNRASAQDSPTRWQRFYLPGPSTVAPVESNTHGASTGGADAQTMVTPIRLELVREFVGDSKHPAVFSLSVEMHSPEQRFRAEANVSMAQSCLDLPGDQNKHGAGEGSKGGAEQGGMNLDKAGVGCNIDMVRDACGASRLPVPRRARTISSPGMLTKLCKHFKSLKRA